MWLLDTSTLELKEFFGAAIPSYAILSHTWSDQELSYQEMQGSHDALRHKAGFQKIDQFCKIAKSLGEDYAWVDTCCIDKKSSAELSEAINSMYTYYRNAAFCVVYLVDVPGTQVHELGIPVQIRELKKSRWFTRGWTLQELIACNQRMFFAKDWSEINSVEEYDLLEIVSRVTRISYKALKDSTTLPSFCVAERMSWAALRQTTRTEDIAYSLMGFFGVHMPILYGEGADSAFRRPQGEIMKTSHDQSIFAWRGPYESSGLLAHAPSDFSNTPPLLPCVVFQLNGVVTSNIDSFAMTNIGLAIRMRINPRIGELHTVDALLPYGTKIGDQWKSLSIHLRRVPGFNGIVNGQKCNTYRRVFCDRWQFGSGPQADWADEEIVVFED